MEFHQAVSPMLEAVSGPHQSKSHISLTDTSLPHETSRSGLVPFPLSSQLCPLGWHRSCHQVGFLSHFCLCWVPQRVTNLTWKIKNMKTLDQFMTGHPLRNRGYLNPRSPRGCPGFVLPQRPGFLRQGEAGHLSLGLAKLPTPRGTCGILARSWWKAPVAGSSVSWWR